MTSDGFKCFWFSLVAKASDETLLKQDSWALKQMPVHCACFCQVWYQVNCGRKMKSLLATPEGSSRRRKTTCKRYTTPATPGKQSKNSWCTREKATINATITT